MSGPGVDNGAAGDSNTEITLPLDTAEAEALMKPNASPLEQPDSLTLAELRKIRSEFPPAQVQAPSEPVEYDQVYDFEYNDSQSLPVELEEWFSYSDREEDALRRCKAVFNEEWRFREPETAQDWLKASKEARRDFVRRQVEVLAGRGKGEAVVCRELMALVYVALGVWEETAGKQDADVFKACFSGGEKGGSGLGRYRNSSLQIRWIVDMVGTLHACDGLRVIYDLLRKACEESFASSPIDTVSKNESSPKRGDESMELWCCLTLMYLFIEVARTTEGTTGKALKQDVLALEPKLINYFTQIVARLRWDEVAPLPLTKLLLISWKTILVTFGGIKEIEHIKATLKDPGPTEPDIHGQPLITASPLDYHLFRQEISSKYPAYQPPPPLFPLEPENNSILPPLKHRRPSYAPSDTAFPGTGIVAATHQQQSILHQPVHIATPAPSPPPSPAGPGKAGKKQNYQTNQMFPFLYPPLDAGSSELGGKGTTQLQDELAGRKWEGADIPASILEAAELFAGRMRATRGMRQLWEARGGFMGCERGWRGVADGDGDVDNFELMAQSEESAAQGKPASPALPEQTEEQKKLAAVGEFYKDSLPHLQSVVIVILKAVLQNVTELVTRTNGQNGVGLGAGIQFNEPSNGINGSNRVLGGDHNGLHSPEGIEQHSPAEELDALRQKEIAAKALSAILLLLLKWFKLSHILQYEYLTQLLLDSNYVPLVLKLWQTQEIGRSCHYKLEREESEFFYFCQVNSRQGAPADETGGEEHEVGKEGFMDESEDDDAAPPPIKLKRDNDGTDEGQDELQQQLPSSPLATSDQSFQPQSDFLQPPEVDELGYPLTPLPAQPLQNYSYRNLFSSINYLRILQKVTRRKTHRALLLVSYKSGNHLKKTLKIPVKMLRYYTLKLFKSQVPFCGRKWRQSNMKIITAVWLSVPAELRDDWLSGGGGGMGGGWVGDVDGTVEDALPLEQALRGLTHWWNVREYGEVMGVEKVALEDGSEFFGRELERMEGRGMDGDVEEEAMGDGIGEGIGGEGWRGPVEGY